MFSVKCKSLTNIEPNEHLVSNNKWYLLGARLGPLLSRTYINYKTWLRCQRLCQTFVKTFTLFWFKRICILWQTIQSFVLSIISFNVHWVIDSFSCDVCNASPVEPKWFTSDKNRLLFRALSAIKVFRFGRKSDPQTISCMALSDESLVKSDSLYDCFILFLLTFIQFIQNIQFFAILMHFTIEQYFRPKFH